MSNAPASRTASALSLIGLFAGALTACVNTIPTPTVFDSSKPSAILHFGTPKPGSRDRSILCLDSLRDGRGRVLEFPRDEVIDRGSLALNAGAYVLHVSHCFGRHCVTHHKTLGFTAAAGGRYRAVARDFVDGMEGTGFTVAIVDEAKQRTVAEAEASECELTRENM